MASGAEEVKSEKDDERASHGCEQGAILAEEAPNGGCAMRRSR